MAVQWPELALLSWLLTGGLAAYSALLGPRRAFLRGAMVGGGAGAVLGLVVSFVAVLIEAQRSDAGELVWAFLPIALILWGAVGTIAGFTLGAYLAMAAAALAVEPRSGQTGALVGGLAGLTGGALVVTLAPQAWLPPSHGGIAGAALMAELALMGILAGRPLGASHEAWHPRSQRLSALVAAVCALVALMASAPSFERASWDSKSSYRLAGNVQALLYKLGSADPTVRRDAAWALGDWLQARRRYSAPGASPTSPDYERIFAALLQALADGDPAVRGAATRSLGETRDRRAVAPLARALADPATDDYAARALGHTGDPSAAPALGKALSTPDTGLRVTVVLALGQLGGPEAEALLRQAAQDPDPAVARAAAGELSTRQ